MTAMDLWVKTSEFCQIYTKFNFS